MCTALHRGAHTHSIHTYTIYTHTIIVKYKLKKAIKPLTRKVNKHRQPTIWCTFQGSRVHWVGYKHSLCMITLELRGGVSGSKEEWPGPSEGLWQEEEWEMNKKEPLFYTKPLLSSMSQHGFQA